MEWKVSKEVIEILPHLNSDNLELARVGDYQLVTQKGLYKNGDSIILLPAKSIIPEALRSEYPYLSGANKDRVKEVSLRGELSQGVTLPLEKAKKWLGDNNEDPELIDAIGYGEDISDILGIVKYEPPLPAQLAGQVTGFSGPPGFPCEPHKHDVVQHGAHRNDFDPEEEVLITEKIHGSLVTVFVVVRDGQACPEETTLSSKGLFEKGLLIQPSDTNLYWRAMRATNLELKAEEVAAAMGKKDMLVHFIGEALPVQKGFTYGYDDVQRYGPNATGIRLFAVLDPSNPDPAFDALPQSVRDMWCPILYRGKYKDAPNLFELCQGKEQVSGKECHIREGLVVTPMVRRKVRRGGAWLKTKVINPAYSKKATGDEIS